MTATSVDVIHPRTVCGRVRASRQNTAMKHPPTATAARSETMMDSPSADPIVRAARVTVATTDVASGNAASERGFMKIPTPCNNPDLS